MRRTLFGLARLVIGIGLLWFVLSQGLDAPLLDRAGRLSWLLPALALIALAAAPFEAFRLVLLFRSQGIHLSLLAALRLVSIGLLFNYVVPGGTGGDVAKLYYVASENRGRGVEAAAVLLADRVLALIMLLGLVVVLGLIHLGDLSSHPPLGLLLGTAGGLAVVLAGLALLATSPGFRASRLYLRLTAWPGGKFVDRIVGGLARLRSRGHEVRAALAVGFLGHLVVAFALSLAASVLLPGSEPLLSAFLALLATIANVLPLTPAGLGVGEAASENLFRLVGLTGGAAIVLVWRIATIPLCVLGAVFYIAGRRVART